MHKIIALCLALIFSTFAYAEEELLAQQCLEQLKQQAKYAGLSQALIEAVIPNLKRLPKVIGYDRSQAEFTQTFTKYLQQRVSQTRIKEGRKLYKKHQVFLEHLFRKYGVPGRYLIAFWGLETNYGHYLGKLSTLNSLATLACDERRSGFFSKELIAALKLIAREGLDPDKMLGSWAGAMGHTQFMPSTYYQYAVDGDADGQINLWLSEQDALASGAHYLQQLGWKSGERWGREIQLADNFPYEKTGYKNWQTLSYWKKLDARKANGSPLADVDIKAAILVPAGHTGPKFLIYQNFEIIMNWNRSQLYALAVGLLAERISGSSGLTRTGAKQQPLSRETVLTMQIQLNEKGYNSGEADGIMGLNTQEALQAYQLATGLIADGYPDKISILKLLK